MNEIGKLKRAKLYMDKLANGIDPNSGNRVHVDDIVRDSRVIGCFEYISRVLEWEIEAFEQSDETSKKRPKIKTFITEKQFSELKLNSGECRVSDIAKEINRVIEPNGSKKIQASWINDWLESIGMICKNADRCRVATDVGEDIGITSKLKTRDNGEEYYLNLYSVQAQSFIFDNLRAIIDYHYANK
ncbi:hypothetical protein [Ruminococcus flavefaciens]|uniref:hypothetical protein n=1 Tax=Ruminococcus flavefaciens TaxID=1265 RepID=UPI00048E71F9|nr:hypothetical protein [Ruminococcus flavefaciens]